MIAIIDYGAGNLHSVKNALDYIGAECEITSSAEKILEADAVILPGVGAFGDCMRSLEKAGLIDVVKTAAKSGKPFLGICLGLQLMFEESEETPGVKGLGIFKGKVVKIPDCGLKIPHMGWNSIKLEKESRLFEDNSFVYFVHSYYLQAENENDVAATTDYITHIHASVEHGNIFACQFHPEKSGDVGLQILKNFCEL